jgi:uncharacterized MnhB-related membrane protein
MWTVPLFIILACLTAFMAVRSRQLLISALWLACTSALLAVAF